MLATAGVQHPPLCKTSRLLYYKPLRLTSRTRLRGRLEMATVVKAQYDEFASKYDSVVDLPCCILEGELVRIALGDCAGLTVLDLGGGSGIHARRAIDAGAAIVDVFDISAEMLRMGQDFETRAGRQDRIRWFKADATKPLSEQTERGSLPLEGYDIVMVNWTLDNATSTSGLTGMWENVLSNMKPGGRFLGLRLQNIHAKYMTYGKYGNKLIDFERIPGGLKYKVECLTQPPFSWDTTAMESVYPLTDAIPQQLGLVDFQVMRPEETDLIRKDPKFWHDFLEDPFFAMVTARRV